MCGYVSDKQWTRLRCRRSDSSARELKAEGFTGSIPLLPSGRIEKRTQTAGAFKSSELLSHEEGVNRPYQFCDLWYEYPCADTHRHQEKKDSKENHLTC